MRYAVLLLVGLAGATPAAAAGNPEGPVGSFWLEPQFTLTRVMAGNEQLSFSVGPFNGAADLDAHSWGVLMNTGVVTGKSHSLHASFRLTRATGALNGAGLLESISTRNAVYPMTLSLGFRLYFNQGGGGGKGP